MLKHPSFSLFFKANLFLTILLFLGFLGHYQSYTFSNFLFATLASVSSATLLALILYLLSFPFSFIKHWGITFLGILFVLSHMALMVDFFIYKLFHFHINAMVLNIITSPDAMDSIQAGIAPFITLLFALAGCIYFEIFIYKKIQAFSDIYQKNLNQKLNRIMIVPLFFILLIDKLGFGFGSLFSKNTLLSPIKVIPLYQPLTFTKVAAKYFGFKAEDQAKYSIKTKAALNYPLKPLHIDTNKATFPIFIIALDSVKYTAITPTLTPHIAAFAKDALVLQHHFSGGNSTRFGIFSFIYGLNASYWFSFLHANQKPLLFDILKQRGYDINIFSSTNTNWPEFRKTCYVDIQNKIQDHFEGAPWQKDAQSTKAFIKNIQAHPNVHPLFSFIFLDSPHGYDYPPDENIYQATQGEINYLTITPESDALHTVKKRYKNALHYNDTLVGKMLDSIKDKGVYDDALILFTSDHGQEFFEYGNFGHNTSFSLAQTQIPMFIKLPKTLAYLPAPKGMTAHQDIVPTLLSLLGVTTPANAYSNGNNLFDPKYHRDYTFCANWNNNAILTADTISVFSNLPNKIFSNTVHESKTYTQLPHTKPKNKWILDTINENKKFLK